MAAPTRAASASNCFVLASGANGCSSLTFSMSGSFHVLSNNGFSTVETEEHLNPPSVLVGNQVRLLASWRLGAEAESTEPSAFFCNPGVWASRVTSHATSQKFQPASRTTVGLVQPALKM